MKKFLVILPIMAIILTGCGEKKGTLKCTLSSKDTTNGYDLNAEYTIHYKGDYAEYVESVETVTSDSQTTLTALESTYNSTYNTMNATYGGYTIDISNENGKLVSNVKIDYSKMDLEKLVQDQPTMKVYVKDGKMSKDGLEATYKLMGASCK